MAFSQADLDAIDAALAKGELLVRIDDKEVRYHTADDMLKRRSFIASQLANANNPDGVQPRFKVASFSDE